MTAAHAKNTIAEELFALVEKEQGYAHISDGIGILPESAILDLAESVRQRHAKLARVLKKFLERHGR